MTMMAHCLAGRHGECPGGESAPPGEFGGVICECGCHMKSRSSEGKAQDRKEIEQEFWRAIKDGKDADDFQLYLEQFPEGAYAEQARERLAGLRKKS